jgi:ribonuclease D
MENETPLILVEDQSHFEEIASSLADRPVIAVDTESDSFHHYKERVCLIQISDDTRDIVIDPLVVQDLSSLGPILADSKCVKVLHGADYDVVCLKRDYGFQLVNLFDTMIAAQLLSFPRFGLSDLLSEVFGVSLDKRFQRYDWARRPLQREHLDYARNDTHWLLALHEVFVQRLEKKGRIEAAAEECERIAQREWSGRRQDPSDFLRIKGASSLSMEALRALRRLHEYRDHEARRMNRPVFKVIPDPVLLEIARTLPTDVSSMARVIRPNSPLMRVHGVGMLKSVQSGLADREPLPEPTASERPHRPQAGRFSQVLVEKLRIWRNERVDSEGLPPAMVASNNLIRNLACAMPRTLEELGEVQDMRRWQVQAWGPELLAAILETIPENEAPPASRKRRRHRAPRATVETST